MAKFGLTIHTGKGSKKFKTEAVFFSSYEKVNKWRSTLNHKLLIIEPSYEDNLCLPNTTLSILEAYYKALEMQQYSIDSDNGFISFTLTFKYPGSLIDFLLDDSTNVKNRISSASKALGTLSFIWDSGETSNETKIKLYLTIPIKLILSNAKIWSRNQADLNSLDVFYYKAIR